MDGIEILCRLKFTGNKPETQLLSNCHIHVIFSEWKINSELPHWVSDNIMKRNTSLGVCSLIRKSALLSLVGVFGNIVCVKVIHTAIHDASFEPRLHDQHATSTKICTTRYLMKWASTGDLGWKEICREAWGVCNSETPPMLIRADTGWQTNVSFLSVYLVRL